MYCTLHFNGTANCEFTYIYFFNTALIVTNSYNMTVLLGRCVVVITLLINIVDCFRHHQYRNHYYRYSHHNDNAPEAPPTSDQERQDWITFFKRGYLMSENEVKEQIKTPAVLQAFDMVMLSKLPDYIKTAYDEEDRFYTEKFAAEAMEKGKTEGFLEKNAIL